MIKQVAHACFVVKDLDATIDFYCNKLGMTKAFDFVRDTGERFGCYIHAGHGTFIEAFRRRDLAESANAGSYQHICLQVDDIQEAVGTLRERGVEVGDAKLGSDQSWQAWLADPDGNRIELHAYTPESRQAPWVN